MSLDFEDSRLQEWIRQTALGLGRWASELERRPVLPPLSAAEIRERFDEPLPEEETPVEDLLEMVEEEVFDSATLNAGPHFYGYITGGGNELGILAEMVKAGLNQNNLKRRIGGNDPHEGTAQRGPPGGARTSPDVDG